ncbi:MAG: hypothetical protein AAGD96_34490, partial [Chloroflexota bacterium]
MKQSMASRGINPSPKTKKPIHRLTWLGSARLIGLFILAVGFILQGMATVPLQAQEDETIFVDVSESAGIVNNRRGTEKAIGQAWGDYNNDGWPDLYVTDHAGPN